MSESDIAALRAGDEDAFRELVSSLGSPLVRLALIHAPSRAIAEEIVQDTWISVLRSIEKFEGRSSLRTWIARILVNTARRRAAREGRSVPFSSLGGDVEDAPVDPDRFHPDGPFAGHWISNPVDPSVLPERRLLGAEVRERVEAAIAELGSPQREVFVLRDVEGWSTAEICDVLELTAGNARVLLHRARSKVRRSLEQMLDDARP